MVPIMSNETIKAINSLLSTSSTTIPIRLDTHLSILTLSIIASSAFGQSFEMIPHAKEMICQGFNEAKDIIEYRTLRMINQVKFLDELPFWGKHIVDETRKKLNQFVNQSIIDRRSGKSSSLCSGQDILDLLLSAVDDQGEPFSDQQVKDEALTFVLAGHETTSNLMTWALYVLMLHDDVLQACHEEVDRVLPNGTVPTFEHLSDLQVIEAVLYETLRLYPSAPVFGRQCVKEHTIASSNGKLKIYIPVDTMIVINTYTLHRREDYWPRPLEFDYKRWIRDPVTGLKPKLAHPFAYLPFAAGPRNCIGQNFALLKAKVILAMFVQRCALKLVPGQTIVPEMKGVTMAPKYGLFVYIKKRDI
jgi:cytochrome P450